MIGGLKLQGYFNISVLDGKTLEKKSEHLVRNFITSSGLSFPYTKKFKDCFTHFSLGSGTGQNTIYTSGLESGDANFTNITGLDNLRTTRETFSGVDLARGCYISGGPILIGDYNFKEVMVGTGDSLAFSRITGDFSIPSGDVGLLEYTLKILPPTGVKLFSSVIQDTHIANEFITTCSNWGILSGAYNICHNGISPVDRDGVLGGLFEPSLPLVESEFESEYRCNLYQDNKQFLVDSISGGLSGVGGNYALLGYNYLLNSSNTNTPYNGVAIGTIRTRVKNSRDLSESSNRWPTTGNIKTEQNASNFYNNLSNLYDTTKSPLENSSVTNTNEPYAETGRSRSQIRKFSWGVQTYRHNTNSIDLKLKSLQIVDENNYPFLDMVFGASGNLFSYEISGVGGGLTGYNPTGIPEEDFYFVDPLNALDISFRQSWSSPCPSDVSGCS